MARWSRLHVMPFQLSNAMTRDKAPPVLDMSVPSIVGREIQLHHKGQGQRTVENSLWYVPTPAVDGVEEGWMVVEPVRGTAGALASFIRSVLS